MKILAQTLSLAAIISLVGCAQTRTAANSKPREDYFKNRVTYTGSNIPRDRNTIPEFSSSANSPSQSFARNTPSLYPTDPVIGANAGPSNTGDTGPNTNVGAGPAGSNPLPNAN